MKKGILSGILIVILMVAAVTGLAETAAQTATDPILDLYPGLEMGMLTDDIYSKYGQDSFDIFAFDTDKVEIAMENGETFTSPVSDLYLRKKHEYRGKPLVVVFEIDDNKLISFGAVLNDTELMDELMNEMEKVYGKAQKTAESEVPLLGLVNMMSGKYTFVWKTDTMKIECEYGPEAYQIKYLPIQ